jgi:hypothetical protein
MDKNAPVTKKDLSDLEDRIDSRFKAQDTHLKEMEARLVAARSQDRLQALRSREVRVLDTYLAGDGLQAFRRS